MSVEDASAGDAPKGKDGEDPEASAAAFEALERDFQEVLAQLVGDKSLEKFRMEYEKLHRALKRSHDHEKKLIKKVRELNGEIVNNVAKVHTALKLSQEDQNTIATLRKQIEKAWKLVDVANEKETKAKETITQLKDEITNLTKLVEKGSKMAAGQETMVKELMKTREDLTRQAEEQGVQAKLLEGQLMEMHQTKESLHAENKAKHEDLLEQLELVRARDGEILREQRRRERLDTELRDTRSQLEAKTSEHEQVFSAHEEAAARERDLAKQLRQAKATIEKYHKDYAALAEKGEKLAGDFAEAMKKNQQLHVDANQTEREAKVQREEMGRLTSDFHALERKLDKEHNEKLDLQQKLADTKAPLQALQAEKAVLEKDLEGYRRAEQKLVGEKDGLERQKVLQEKQTQKALVLAKDNSDQAKEQERVAYSLEAEANALKTETKEQRALIYQVEREREKYGVEAVEQRKLYEAAVHEVKLRDSRIVDLLKKVADWEKKMKQQQALYEAVRSERNLTAKNLVEAQDEIAELQRKFKIMQLQTEQLKEEIGAKDTALVKESFEHQRINKKAEQQEQKISRADKLLRANEDVIHKQDAEIARLAGMIRRMDDEALTQRKEYDQVINERDILGTQLIRRNDELALLYEKLKIQMSTLRTGEAQYGARLEDLRVLRLKVKDLMRELALSRSQGGSVDDSRRELIAAQKELLLEKAKVKALSDELENPLNVHRWRKLEGSDPATYEMIQKIQTLQKRLIKKTEEVVDRDLLLVEKDKLYDETKKVLARQPGPEVAEQLSAYQQKLRSSSKAAKHMASELNMYQAQSQEFKHEVERLARELQDAKRKLYEQRRRDQLAQDAMFGGSQGGQLGLDGGGSATGGGSGRLLGGSFGGLGHAQAQQQLAAAQAATTRRAGGGFAIK
mmetsp:Transcript_40025/g.89752  ORF Transcript_40025/g.89752 Transcript_40025/m.89752 type:complete len:912 (+) Transcript_40025:82-2817(+)